MYSSCYAGVLRSDDVSYHAQLVAGVDQLLAGAALLQYSAIRRLSQVLTLLSHGVVFYVARNHPLYPLRGPCPLPSPFFALCSTTLIAEEYIPGTSAAAPFSPFSEMPVLMRLTHLAWPASELRAMRASNANYAHVCTKLSG